MKKLLSVFMMFVFFMGCNGEKEKVIRNIAETQIKAEEKQEHLGSWKDYVNESWNLDIAIHRRGRSYYALITFHAKGDSLTKRYDLAKIGDNTFRKTGTADYYKIENDGSLGLYDDEGFIRKARKL